MTLRRTVEETPDDKRETQRTLSKRSGNTIQEVNAFIKQFDQMKVNDETYAKVREMGKSNRDEM